MKNLFFCVSDYYATGEGRDVSVMIIKYYPRKEDYIVKPSFIKDENGTTVFQEGVLRNIEISLKEIFLENFGSFDTYGFKILEKDDFFKKYNWMVPDYVKNIINSSQNESPGAFFWKASFYLNFS
jgi:hypothetical protein